MAIDGKNGDSWFDMYNLLLIYNKNTLFDNSNQISPQKGLTKLITYKKEYLYN